MTLSLCTRTKRNHNYINWSYQGALTLYLAIKSIYKRQSPFKQLHVHWCSHSCHCSIQKRTIVFNCSLKSTECSHGAHRYHATGTAYYPDPSPLEGGYLDMRDTPLKTLQVWFPIDIPLLRKHWFKVFTRLSWLTIYLVKVITKRNI